MKEYQVDVYNLNNELVYEEKNMTCNDEQFDTFIKLLTNELVYGKKESWWTTWKNTQSTYIMLTL